MNMLGLGAGNPMHRTVVTRQNKNIHEFEAENRIILDEYACTILLSRYI